MRLILLQIGAVVATVALVAIVADSPVSRAWGSVGTAALLSSAWISLIAGLLAIAPLGAALLWAPKLVPQLAFAGTAVRLIVTGTLAVAWQALTNVHLNAFLTCLTVFYLTLLVVETTLTVIAVRGTLTPPATEEK